MSTFILIFCAAFQTPPAERASAPIKVDDEAKAKAARKADPAEDQSSNENSAIERIKAIPGRYIPKRTRKAPLQEASSFPPASSGFSPSTDGNAADNSTTGNNPPPSGFQPGNGDGDFKSASNNGPPSSRSDLSDQVGSNPANSFNPRSDSGAAQAADQTGSPAIKRSNFSLVDDAESRPLRSRPDSTSRQVEGTPASSNLQDNRPVGTRGSFQNPNSSSSSSQRPSSTAQRPSSSLITGSSRNSGNRGEQSSTNPQFAPPSSAPKSSFAPDAGDAGDAAAQRAAEPAASANSNRLMSEPRIQPTIASENLNARSREKAVEDTTFNPNLKLLAEQLLRSLPRNSSNRLSLADVLDKAMSAAQRKSYASDYWNGFANQADVVFAGEEIRLLQSAGQPSSRFEQAMLRAAISSAEARLAEAKMAARKSDAQLRRIVTGLAPEEPITFADLPWVGKYRTNTEGFISSGRFNGQIRKVDQALPELRDLTHRRAAAVGDNLHALSEALTAWKTGAVRLETVLQLHREVRDQRIAFLSNVRDYNVAISEYAFSVFPNASEKDVIAGMLVDTSLTLPPLDAQTDFERSPLRQADRRSPANSGRIRDPQVRPASGF